MSADIDQLFSRFSKMKVAVIGDVMLDTYWWGNVERISPEAPVPVVAVSKREKRIGGAGNVALNVQALGASVALLTILGDDEDGVQLKNLLEEKNIDTRFILESKKRITTNKIRIISRNQQMMRLDAEIIHDIDDADEEKLQNQIEKFISTEKPDVVIFEDYNKGILTKNIIANTIAFCIKNNVTTAVDPKRKNFFCYQNATLFKPNLNEAITGLNLLPEEISPELLSEIHLQLKEKLDHDISLITLSEKGIFYQEENNKKILPSHRRNIADVSGAGDTVIAVASLIYAATKDINLAARIANIAGGIVCEEVGTVAINKEKLLEECKKLIH
ncbi:MAG TPA: PfkB family carbohydrate kinase [Hanamia sp.]|jgi:D-glycero-beta-D-manno-heptose-7-phosphate kinase|nr:PfkB family carbohydrate kinase [Hanamia sp.]